MNPSGEEKRIRDLFDELRREDERAAPHFARDWTAARARMRDRRLYPRRRLLAAAVAVLLAAAAVAFVTLRQRGAASQEIASPIPIPPAPAAVNPTPLPEGLQRPEVIPAVRASKTKGARRSRAYGKQMHAAVSLSGWRSPTDSLLKSPADEMLKSLPRIGESVKEMKAMLKDRMN